MQPVVLKIGGHDLRDASFLYELAECVRELRLPLVLVHGGGVEIAELQQRLGIQPTYVQGLRVTDSESLALVEMVLGGLVNKRLVRVLVQAGVDALGMSGVDCGLVRARKMPHDEIDMAFTGEVSAVRAEIIHDLLSRRITPVVAPVCLGTDSAYNVNADHVAGALAVATNASRIVFLTNVDGVLLDGQRLTTLTEERARALIAQGAIFGGMIPKVETALQALATGVPEALITNLAGLKEGGGTLFRTGQDAAEKVSGRMNDKVGDNL